MANFAGAILELLLRENDYVLQGFHTVQLEYLCSVQGFFPNIFFPQSWKD